MRTATLCVAAMAVCGMVLFAAVGRSEQVPPELKGRVFMQRKLEHSQKVLEGIVIEDFQLIEKNAHMLGLLSQAAEWQFLPSAEYRKHSEDFRQTTMTLGKAARDRNLDGAALAYLQLTLNCVNCHKYVRSLPFDKRPKPMTDKGLIGRTYSLPAAPHPRDTGKEN